VKNIKRDAIKLPDLRNGVLGSLWFSKADGNFAGKSPLPAGEPLPFTQ
jgi:hypothetical protein